MPFAAAQTDEAWCFLQPLDTCRLRNAWCGRLCMHRGDRFSCCCWFSCMEHYSASIGFDEWKKEHGGQVRHVLKEHRLKEPARL